MPKPGFVYILASRRGGTLYIGVTSDLPQRIWQHHHAEDDASFTARYDVKRLVYYEAHRDIRDAIVREKQLKKWNRDWKLRLINEVNPEWRDLAVELKLLP